MVKGYRKNNSAKKKESKKEPAKSKGISHSEKRNFKYVNIIKNIESIGNFFGPSVIDIINSLDTPISNSEDSKNNKIFQLQIFSDISKREFYNYFMNGINYAKSNYNIKSLKILKKILLLLIDPQGNKDDEFGIKNKKNNLYQTFKMDLILSLISDENKITSLGVKDIADTEKLFKQSYDYDLLKDPTKFENIIQYNKNIKDIYSLENFEKIFEKP